MTALLLLPLAVAQQEVWHGLLEVLLLLGAAMILGSLAERLRQSAIVGYLIAGSIIGPGALGWVSNQQSIFGIAELGVALLLFAIGLEFSPKRLMDLGKVPLLAGALQVLFTLVGGAAIVWLCGLPLPSALVIGAMVALSSTACVLRILSDRAEIDSPYGRISLGILLVQDIAVVPLMLLVTILSDGGSPWMIVRQMAVALVSAALLIIAFYGLFNHVAPRLLSLKSWQRNRDLPILLAVVMAMGSAWVAHWLGLSPALGAFVAGVLLAVSPFAVQIRADIEPVKTILVTLFFAAVGMFGDVAWLLQNLGLVCGVVLAIVIGKGSVTALATRLSGGQPQFAIASAFCLAQVGEFSFVLATIARGLGDEAGLLSDTAFRAIISATIISLLITPYLISMAPHAGARLAQLGRKSATPNPLAIATDVDDTDTHASIGREAIFVVGFGPAGQRASEDLIESMKDRLVVVDINSDNVAIARRYGLEAHIGDATQTEILEHARISRAAIVIITVPSPLTGRKLVHLIRYHAPDAMIFARARYHIHRWQLVQAGAHVVVDEEDRVGHQLAEDVQAALRQQGGE
ncbi:sodium:proton exchanger [Roseiconus nitratireducens]|uniref:Sodium:proton exchanger n=1 Tax=Roseiconus nitratireducens TaxID=2605748 RepID=A0A5M6CUA5_9BACT|nr:cation:proton antiporter [Roseiconus nitratireducens]KAA5538771.1 sodium:proton exchanger [Roseiconus nitratireducens]